MAVDAKGYGSAPARRQAAMQDWLIRILGVAADAAGLRRSRWECQPGGDGELAVLPPDESEAVLIDRYVWQLHSAVEDLNEDLLPEARLRLRLAIHHGMVQPAANGYAGAGVVVVSRLVDCGPLRAVQEAAPDAGLVVVLSDRVFQDTVAQGHTVLRPRSFRRVAVQAKEFQDTAWLHVPGAPCHGCPDFHCVSTGS